MKFLPLNDINGRHHLVNPMHIAAIQEADSGCIVHVRGRNLGPIALNETVEVMHDALDAMDESEFHPKRKRFNFMAA